jgi:hypothetical protein
MKPHIQKASNTYASGLKTSRRARSTWNPVKPASRHQKGKSPAQPPSARRNRQLKPKHTNTPKQSLFPYSKRHKLLEYFTSPECSIFAGVSGECECECGCECECECECMYLLLPPAYTCIYSTHTYAPRNRNHQL